MLDRKCSAAKVSLLPCLQLISGCLLMGGSLSGGGPVSCVCVCVRGREKLMNFTFY